MIDTSLSLLCISLLLLSASVLSQRECTEDDWVYQYTDCRVSSNTRDLLYFKNPKTDNCEGGVPCPDSIFDLQCDIACGAGSYLPPGSTVCAKCPPGTYTIGGGERVIDFSSFPFLGSEDILTFSTYATDNYGRKYDNKGLWEPADNGLTLRSGIINNSQNSFLDLPVHLVMDGHVSFDYTVEAENKYDGLEFYVDNVRKMNLESQQTKPVTFTTNLTRGYHTLTWKYLKDNSASVGADAAWIISIEILGITYSEDSCQPCPAGYYSDKEGAGGCVACPRNTFAPNAGATECDACDDTKYSLEGATECIDRTDCTDSDYTSTYSPCRWDSSLQKFVRDKTYSWLPTTTCKWSSSHLPADENGLACELCNPGMVRDRTNGKCTWCSAGTISDPVNNKCTPCTAGSASNPGLFITQWVDGDITDQYDGYGIFNSSCDGTCGTPGWTVVDGVAMSGVGHSNSVTSVLEMHFMLEKPSAITYTYFAKSANIYDARLVISVRGGASQTHWSGDHESPAIESIALEPGNHTVEFTFVHRSSYSTISTNAAYIYNISIPGAFAPHLTSTGARATGSDTCVSCASGSYTSVDGKEWCDLCEPGSSSSLSATGCGECPKDFFNDVAGGVCRQCGANVHTEGPGSVDCDNTCSFRFETQDDDIVFDLSPLSRDGILYGPITDDTAFSYFIGVCQRNSADNTTTPCKDASGEPLKTYACQQEPRCPYGETCSDFSIGNIAGYTILDEEDPRKGFVLMYTGGTVTASGTRSTNVTFICAPGGGVGAPHPPENRSIEGPKCHYEFVWESEYGCPLCTEADYSFIYGECKNNTRRKMYYWLSNPRQCHDGVELPEDEDIPTNCTSRVVCEPGYFVDGIKQECTPCAPGTTSVGAGELLLASEESGSALPSQLSSACTGPDCMPFIVDHRQYHASSSEDTTVTLRYTTRYLINGTLSFSYSLFGVASESSSSVPSFVFSMDDKVLLSDSDASVHSAVKTFNVFDGAHTFAWVVSGPVMFADISYIHAYGNSYAPTSCSACPNGYYQDESAQGVCKRCPAGQVSAPGFTGCQECPQGSYTIDGVECVTRPECTVNDWVALHTPCHNRTRKLVWTKLHPAVCEGGYTPDMSSDDDECAPCSTGMWREEGSDECVGCQVGEVFDGSKCVKPDTGTVSFHTREFFTTSTSSGKSGAETVLPDGWTTTASSPALPEGTVTGWRVRVDGIDAGLSRGAENVISTLSYTTPVLLSNGFVVFDYRIAEPNDQLLFFINGKHIVGKPTQLPNGFNRIQVTVPESVGRSEVTLMWAAVMGSANFESDSAIMMQNVRIGGLTSGMASVYYCKPGTQANEEQSFCVVCEPGTASNVSGRPCRACEFGTYASRSGQNKCSSCYSGSVSDSQTGSKRCVTSCSYEGPNNTVYKLSDLGGTVFGPVTANELGGSFFFSLCDGVMPKGECGRHATQDEYMHSCFTDGERSTQTDFGSQPEFVLADSGSEEDLSFLLNFHDGGLCNTSDGSKRLQTQILFRCSVDAGAGFPQFLSFSSSTCTATFSWATQYACHMCTEDDYELVVSACTNSLQRTERHKIGRCNGPDRVLVEEVSCTDIAVPIGLVAGAVGLIIIMIGVIIFVVYKNRKITIKYTKLLADQSAELEAMADEDDSMAKKLAPPSHDDDDEDDEGNKKHDGDSEDDADEPRDDDDDDDDDGQGVGHIRK